MDIIYSLVTGLIRFKMSFLMDQVRFKTLSGSFWESLS